MQEKQVTITEQLIAISKELEALDSRAASLPRRATGWRAIVGAHMGTPFARVFSTKIFALRAQAMSWAAYELKDAVSQGWNDIQINIAPDIEVTK